MKKKFIIVGLVIFVLALFLRVYRIESRYQFGLDEEYQATLAMTIVKDFHPIWIGVSASDTGFYLGPYWTYLTALLLSISGGGLMITAYMMALIGSVTALIIYLVVKKYVNFGAGVISGILYSILPIFVFFDQKYWNPSLIPLIVISFIYLALDVKNQTKLLLLAALMALIFHVHLSLMALFIPLGFVLVKNYKTIKKSSLVKALGVFLIFNIPLIIFDYYKKGSNILSIIGLSNYKGEVNPFNQLVNIVKSSSRLFYLQPGLEASEEVLSGCATFVKSNPSMVIGSVALLLVVVWAIKSFKKSEFNKLVIITLGSFIGLTLIFKGVFREYYLMGMFVLIIIALASLLSRFNKVIVSGFLLVIMFFSFKTIILAKENFGLRVKKELIEKVSLELKEKTYRVVESGSCHKYAGWRYLFNQYASNPPNSSNTDNILGWLYRDEVSSEKADLLITVMATKELPEVTGEQIKIDSGGFTALIEPGI